MKGKKFKLFFVQRVATVLFFCTLLFIFRPASKLSVKISLYFFFVRKFMATREYVDNMFFFQDNK